MPTEPRLSSTYTRHWPVLALVVVALYSLWITFRPEALTGGLFAIVLVFGVRAATALAAERGLRRIPGEAAQHVWRNLVVGLLIWALADAATLIQAILQGRSPTTPALRDLLMVAGYFGILTAIIRYRPSQKESFGRLREILDVSILILSVVALAWLVFLGPAVDAAGLQVSTIIWLAIRPILDLTLLLLILRLLIVQDGQIRAQDPGGTPAWRVPFFHQRSRGQLAGNVSIPNLSQSGRSWMDARHACPRFNLLVAHWPGICSPRTRARTSS